MSNKKYAIKLKTASFASSAVLLSIALILGYVETVLPIDMGIIGIKIGLPSIVTLISLKCLGTRRAFAINALRVIIIGMLFPSATRFFISVVGFLMSFLVMLIFMKILRFDMVPTSILGGVFHNIGQLLAVAYLTKRFDVFGLVYFYIFFGIISGAIIGIIGNICYSKIIKLKEY